MEDKFTKSNFMSISQEVLDFQLNALYPVQIEKEPTRINLVFLNHDRNFSTFLTIRYLVQHERVADIYALSRSIFESIITMGLLSKRLIEEDIERYQNFQFIEIYKTYNHLKKLGLEHLNGVSSSDVEFLYKKREEYIKKWGKNTLSWSGRSLEQNVKLVDKNYAPTCNEKHFYEYLYCQVYRKGSQSTHSSFAGLSKGVSIDRFSIPGLIAAQRFKANENHLIFSCFHSLLIFLSSVRFLGYLLDKKETENYFHKIAKYIISDE
jgi:hypothetical protein